MAGVGLGFRGHHRHHPLDVARGPMTNRREQAIARVAGFLRLNYPCECPQPCSDPSLDEAEAIVEMVTEAINGENHD